MISPAIMIQHASHDMWRRANVNTMLKALAPHSSLASRISVVKDIDKSVWHTYRKCAHEGLYPAGASHVVILQDDLLLCKDFLPGLNKIIEYRPADIITLFYVSKHAEEARETDRRWIRTADVWGQAVVWPREPLTGFLQWSASELRDDWPTCDARATLYIALQKLTVWATAPSLVQHLRSRNSLIGIQTPQPRIARWFIGDASALEYDWSRLDFVKAPMVSFYSYAKKCHAEKKAFKNPDKMRKMMLPEAR